MQLSLGYALKSDHPPRLSSSYMATGGEPTAKNCKDCKSSLNLGKEILSCSIHYIWLCRNCLSERARERIGFDCDDCAIGRSKIFFMDHSNTWIEAKKIKASGEYTQDNRIRLEAGRLISCVGQLWREGLENYSSSEKFVDRKRKVC